jgi:hypothetical protein
VTWAVARCANCCVTQLLSMTRGMSVSPRLTIEVAFGERRQRACCRRRQNSFRRFFQQLAPGEPEPEGNAQAKRSVPGLSGIKKNQRLGQTAEKRPPDRGVTEKGCTTLNKGFRQFNNRSNDTTLAQPTRHRSI